MGSSLVLEQTESTSVDISAHQHDTCVKSEKNMLSYHSVLHCIYEVGAIILVKNSGHI
jgi:hypothetical protein